MRNNSDDDVEGFFFESGEIVYVEWGIRFKKNVSKPGGWIRGLHINTSFVGIRIQHANSFMITGCSIFCNTWFEKKEWWFGIDVKDCYGFTITDVIIRPSFDKNQITQELGKHGIRLTKAKKGTISQVYIRGVNRGVVLNDSKFITLNNAVIEKSDRGVFIGGCKTIRLSAVVTSKAGVEYELPSSKPSIDVKKAMEVDIAAS